MRVTFCFLASSRPLNSLSHQLLLGKLSEIIHFKWHALADQAHVRCCRASLAAGQQAVQQRPSSPEQHPDTPASQNHGRHAAPGDVPGSSAGANAVCPGAPASLPVLRQSSASATSAAMPHQRQQLRLKDAPQQQRQKQQQQQHDLLPGGTGIFAVQPKPANVCPQLPAKPPSPPPAHPLCRPPPKASAATAPGSADGPVVAAAAPAAVAPATVTSAAPSTGLAYRKLLERELSTADFITFRGLMNTFKCWLVPCTSAHFVVTAPCLK